MMLLLHHSNHAYYYVYNIVHLQRHGKNDHSMKGLFLHYKNKMAIEFKGNIIMRNLFCLIFFFIV